jgi:hypothetical protein
MAPCNWAAVQSAAGFGEFLDGCFPSKTEERTLTEIDSRIRGAAYELDGDYAKAGAVLGNIVFVARDADAAKRLEKDVIELTGDWKEHLRTYDAKLITESQNKAVTRSQKKFAAVVDTFFTAMRHMKVTRSGRTVRIGYEEKLSKDDIQEIKDADKSTEDNRIATAEIVNAIQARRPVPQSSLAVLVGSRWATYLTGPVPANLTPPAKFPVSNTDCQQIQRQLASVKYSDVAPPSRDLYFQFRWSSCAAGKTPEVSIAQRTCLLSSKTANEFSACTGAPAGPANEPPESEFGAKK